MPDRSEHLRPEAHTPTPDAAPSGFNTAIGRSLTPADLGRAVCACSVAPAPEVDKASDTAPTSPRLSGQELADAYLEERENGEPSPDAWMAMLECGGFDVAFGRAHRDTHGRSPAKSVSMILDLVIFEFEDAAERLHDAYQAGGREGAPKGHHLNHARGLLAAASAWFYADKGHSHLETACSVLAEVVTAQGQHPLAEAAGIVAAHVYSLVSLYRNRGPKLPEEIDDLAHTVEIDARRLHRALTRLSQATTPGNLGLRHHAAGVFELYAATCELDR